MCIVRHGSGGSEVTPGHDGYRGIKEVSENDMEIDMNRKILTSIVAAVALLLGATIAVAQQFGTAAEAKAMLEKAVAALKANEADALAKFNSPTGGFRDRDLYVFCFDMTTGKFNAHVNPALMGTDARALKVKEQSVGQMVFAAAKKAPSRPWITTSRSPERRSLFQGILRDACGQRRLRSRLLQVRSIWTCRKINTPRIARAAIWAKHYGTNLRQLLDRSVRLANDRPIREAQFLIRHR